jgi:type IV secretion system protein VirB6
MAGFYTQLFDKLSGTLSGYVGTTSSSVMGAITPVASTMVAIYVCFWGWSMMRGVINEPITDGVTRIARLAVIVAVATTGGYYSSFISDWLWNSPDVLASYVAGDSQQTNVQYLDTLWNKEYDLGAAFMAKAKADSTYGIPDLTMMAAGVGIWATGIICTGYAAFLLALSKMALAIVLGVGPIFVLLLIFEPTKRFFDSWLGQALNYLFLVMLTAAAVKLILTIVEAYLTKMGAVVDPTVSDAIPAIALSAVGFLVLMQMPSIASALGGGVAVGTLGAVGNVYGRARNAMGSSKDVLTGKTLSDMRGARRTRDVNRRWAQRNPGAATRAARAPGTLYRKITTPRANRVSASP